MNIKEAVLSLDPNVPQNWTNEGLPLLAAISMLAGETVTRVQINEAMPGYSRQSALDKDKPVPDAPPTEVELIKAEIADRTADVDAAQTAFTLAKDAHNAAILALDEASNKLVALQGVQTSPKTIVDYLQKRQQHIDAVSKGEATSDRSQLDKVMARRTGHGNRRPNYGAK